MLINISPQNLRAAIASSVTSPQQRRSVLGMLNTDKDAAVRFLERAGVVQVDWNYQCPCGACDPEPLVNLTPGNHD